MKVIKHLALAGLVFANCSVFAATPMEGWYAGLMGGVSFTPGLRLPAAQYSGTLPLPLIIRTPSNPNPRLPFLLDASRSSLTHGVGWDFGGQVGYRICNFRFEGELIFNYAPFSQFRSNLLFITPGHVLPINIAVKRHPTSLFTPPTPLNLALAGSSTPTYVRMGGRTAFGAGLFNAFYDFYDEEEDPTWVPYLGLGIGYAYIQNRLTLDFYNGAGVYLASVVTNGNRNKTAPIGQVILGIDYYYSDNTAIGLDYRYITTNTIKNLNARVQTNTLNLNFNYWFDDN